jgi:transposase-like protein
MWTIPTSSARRVKGKRGRGAGGKIKVFGIFKRNGSLHTEIVPDCRKKTLQAVIGGRVSLEAVVDSDKWRGYDGLVDVGYKKHFRVNHSADEFVDGDSHIVGIESFWSFSKRRLQKFNGVSGHTFYLHLEESEYRFNHRRENLFPQTKDFKLKNRAVSLSSYKLVHLQSGLELVILAEDSNIPYFIEIPGQQAQIVKKDLKNCVRLTRLGKHNRRTSTVNLRARKFRFQTAT